MPDINAMSPQSGRVIKENNEIINTADILSDVYDSENGALKTSSESDVVLTDVYDSVKGALKTLSDADAILTDVHDSVKGALKTLSDADAILTDVHDSVNNVLKTSSDADFILADVHDSVNNVLKTSSESDVILADLRTLTTASLGQYGSKRIINTNATTPTAGKVFTAIQVIEDTVFTTLVGDMDSADGLTLGLGTVIYGRFTSITLASGKVIAYMGV